MGGYQAGDEASSLTARTVANHFGPVVVAAASGRPADGAAIAAALNQSLHEANRIVHQRANTESRCQEMVALGKLTPEQAATHEARNEVTQAIGKRQSIEPSRAEQALQRGDFLLVACDGLAAHVEQVTIQQALSRPAVPFQHLATQLVSMADAGGGTDNCSNATCHEANP